MRYLWIASLVSIVLAVLVFNLFYHYAAIKGIAHLPVRRTVAAPIQGVLKFTPTSHRSLTMPSTPKSRWPTLRRLSWRCCI